jgi:hypothetical protein
MRRFTVCTGFKWWEALGREAYYKSQPTNSLFLSWQVIEANPAAFPLDKQLTKEDITAIVERTSDRLTSKDDPALETIKMQVRCRLGSITIRLWKRPS